MKRWYPIFFLGLSLLANVIVHIRYTQFLEAWTPTLDYTNPQPLGLFALMSAPLGLLYIWREWGIKEQTFMCISRARRICGNTLLVLSIASWVYFCVDGLVSAWIAETSATDPLRWLQQSSYKHKISVLSLLLGGLLALWLKGLRIPPRTQNEVK